MLFVFGTFGKNYIVSEKKTGKSSFSWENKDFSRLPFSEALFLTKTKILFVIFLLDSKYQYGSQTFTSQKW